MPVPGPVPVPAHVPVNSNGFRAATEYNAAPKPLAQPARTQVTAFPAPDAGRNTPALTPARFYPTNTETLPLSFRSKSVKFEEPVPTANKKKMILTAVSAAVSVLILVVLIAQFYPKLFPKIALAKQSTVQQPAATITDSSANTVKPSPATPLAGSAQPIPNNPKSLVGTQLSPATQSANAFQAKTTDAVDTTSPQVESTMMDNQLAAATRIPQDLKVVAKKEAPPAAGFGGVGMEGMGATNGNAIGNVFANGGKGPKVKPEVPTKVNISSGVAQGLLIQKTVPLYPAIAKSARVSGTVVLQAVISRAGSIANVRVIAGPAMLQQSAMDAVRSWRYRPFLLNGSPVEVETTVNVVFSIQ
jgi:TonB family protein